jgi:hypothetical protein
MTTPRRLPRNVVVLGLVSFFTDVSSEMLYPVVPLFLTNTLGVVPALAGIVEGVAEAVASVMKGLSGRWSDRFQRRKPFVVAGYSFSAVAKALLAGVTSWWTVGAMRAMVVDLVPAEWKGTALGWHGAVAGLLTLAAAALVTTIVPRPAQSM